MSLKCVCGVCGWRVFVEGIGRECWWRVSVQGVGGGVGVGCQYKVSA